MVRPASPHRERGLEMLRGGATAAQVATELGGMIVSSLADLSDTRPSHRSSRVFLPLQTTRQAALRLVSMSTVCWFVGVWLAGLAAGGGAFRATVRGGCLNRSVLCVSIYVEEAGGHCSWRLRRTG
jgi:hypothetical protein